LKAHHTRIEDAHHTRIEDAHHSRIEDAHPLKHFGKEFAD
jgi:hypothetical protein